MRGFGPRGFFHEGQGPSNTAAYPALLSFFQSLRNVKGRDYITPNEDAHWVTLRHIGESTISSRGAPIYPVRYQMMGQQYGSQDMTPPGVFNANGRFSIGFGAIPEKYHGALRWIYDTYVTGADNEGFDTRNYPHLAISALVNWPIDTPAQNPEGLVPQAYRDQAYGHYVVRNGWDPDNDVIMTWFTAKAGGTRVKPWQALPLVVWGAGRQLEINLGWEEKRTKETYFETDQTTTLLGFSDGLFAVDYSDRSGAMAVLFSTKKLDTGFFGEILSQKVGKLHVLTVNKGKDHPKAVQVGDAVVVGNLKAVLRDGRLEITDAGADGSSEMVDAFVLKGIDPLIDAITDETMVHPGTPDHLISFDYDSLSHRDGDLYFNEATGQGYQALAYNLRPDHLTDGVFGQAMQFRKDGAVPSILTKIDAAAEATQETTIGDVEMEGIFSSVKIPAAAQFKPIDGDRTLSAWVRLPEPRDGYAWLFSDANTKNFAVGFHPGPRIMSSGGFGGVSMSYPNDGGVWRHVAWVRDVERNTTTLYLDGEFQARERIRKRCPRAVGYILWGWQ